MKGKSIWTIFLILTIGFFSLFTLWNTGYASGTTITVDDDGGTDFQEIQDAIDTSQNGDTIRVFEGTYHGFMVNKSVSLIGNGSDVTKIDAEGGRYGARISANWVNMSGFSVSGTRDEITFLIESAGIYITSNNCMISFNNCSNNDQGIFIEHASNSTIINNSCYLNEDSAIVIITSYNCQLLNNTCSSNGGGITFINTVSCSAINNLCSNNDCGIALFYANDCEIDNNICSMNNDYGINIDEISVNCSISNNTCTKNDYGIYTHKIEQNSYTGNVLIENEIANIEEYGKNNDDDGTNGGIIPGFELEVLIPSITIISYFYRKIR